MPENISNTVIIALFVGIGVLAMVSILVRLVKNRYAPIKTVKAVVIDKNKIKREICDCFLCRRQEENFLCFSILIQWI